MAVKKKIRPKIPQIAGVSDIEWVCIGVDLSLATCSVGAICKLKTGKIRVGAFSVRWQKDHDYFDRLKTVADPYMSVFYPLFEQMKIQPAVDKTFIAYEEPVSFGHMKRGLGGWIKQQIQISGAFVGGVLRAGYPVVIEIQANKWRAMVAHDLGITIHTSKWNDPATAPEIHCSPKNVGKYRAQQWVQQFYPEWDGHWTDIIAHGKLGIIPRPIDSKAQGIQSDDRYEALAMAEWLRREMKS